MIIDGVEYKSKAQVKKAMSAKKGSRICTKIDSSFHTPELYESICSINQDNIKDIVIDEISATIFRNSFEYTNKFHLDNTKIELIYNDTEQHLTSISYNGTMISSNSILWIGDFPCEIDEEVEMSLLRDYVTEVNRYTRLCLNRGWHMANHIASKTKQLVFPENVVSSPNKIIQIMNDVTTAQEIEDAEYKNKGWLGHAHPRLKHFFKGNAIVFKNLKVAPYSYITYDGYMGLFNEYYEITHIGVIASEAGDVYFLDVMEDTSILSELETVMQDKIHDKLTGFMENQISVLL